MTKNIKVNAAILIIGNEILSGRTQDTNTSTLATWLNTLGVKINEVRVVPDEEKKNNRNFKYIAKRKSLCFYNRWYWTYS